jgi:DNA mismatch endonuclease (patch repair protein)
MANSQLKIGRSLAQASGGSAIAALSPRRRRDPLTRSQIMSRIRSRNTSPEKRVRSALHRLGLRFRKHAAELPGKPDLANRRKHWVVFVHGCFWHSHEGCPLASRPRTNSTYWEPKLRGNLARDWEHYRQLELSGYRVFVIWECETRRLELLDGAVRAVADCIQREELVVRPNAVRQARAAAARIASVSMP